MTQKGSLLLDLLLCISLLALFSPIIITSLSTLNHTFHKINYTDATLTAIHKAIHQPQFISHLDKISSSQTASTKHHSFTIDQRIIKWIE